MQTTFAEHWKDELADDARSPVLFTEREHPDKMLDLGVKLIDVFLAKVEKPHRVVGVEESFLVELHNPADGAVLDERLLGVFDLVVQNEDGSHTIVDHKSAARRYSSTKTDFDLQVSAYHYAAPSVGLGDANVELQVLLKTKSPDMEIYRCHRNGASNLDFLRTTVGVLKAIRAGVSYPVHDWHCTSCPYKGRCMAG